MGYESQRQAIAGHFNTEWAGATPIQWEGIPFEATEDQPYVSFWIIPNRGDRITLGASSEERFSDIVQIDINVPLEGASQVSPEKIVSEYADTIMGIFLNQSVETIKFRGVNIFKDHVDGWLRWSLAFETERDENFFIEDPDSDWFCTVKEGGVQVGDDDIEIFDFDGDHFDINEDPDKEVNISLVTPFTPTEQSKLSGIADGADVTADNPPQAHEPSHGVGGADSVFPADPGADRYLKWDDDPGELVWDSPAGSGTVDTSGTPAQYDFARFTDENTIEGRDYSEVKQDLSLNNVENTQHSIDAHTMTIDGRDVSADGNKLDGIATGADVTADNPPQAHKDSHDPEDGSDALDTAAAANLDGVQAGAEGSAHSFARSDHAHRIQHSIADNAIITMDDADAETSDYAKFTADGLEGRSYAEVKQDLSLNNVENTQHSIDAHTMTIDGRDVSADGNKLDGIATGADVTADNAPQAHKDSHDPEDGSDALDTAAPANIDGVQVSAEGSSHSLARADHVHRIQHSIADDALVTIDDSDAASGDYAKFTANGLEGRDKTEMLSDLNVADGADVTADNTCDTPGGAGTDTTAIHDNETGEINALSDKASPVGADILIIEDSAASFGKKKVSITNLPGGADSDAIHDNVDGEINAIANKASPVGADILVIEDSEASYAKKKVSITNLPGGADADAIHDNVDGEINAVTTKATPVGADVILIEDSAATYAKKKATLSSLPGGTPDAHKDSHDPEDGSDALDTAAPSELAGVQTSGVGSSHSLARADHTHQIQHSIADDHLVTMDDSDAASGDYARFTADGLEGRDKTEMLSDLNVADGADVTANNTCDTPGGAGTDTTAIHDNETGEINALTDKASPVGADLLIIEDSAASFGKKKVSITNLPGGTPSAHKDSHDPEDGSDALDTAAPSELAGVQASGVGSSHSLARADHQHQIQHGISDNHIVTIDSTDVGTGEFAKFTIDGLEGRTVGEMQSDLNVADGADVTANNTCDTPGGAGTDTTAIHDNETGEINALSDKASPVGADILVIEDSAASWGKKKVSITNLPGGSDADAIHDNVDGEINAIAVKGTPVDADIVVIEDSAASWAKKKAALSTLPGGTPSAHKDSHDPEDGSDALDTAAPPELVGVQASAVGTSHSLARADHGHQIQHGIADNHLVTIDSIDVGTGEFAKFTANGLEGRTVGEMQTDLNFADGADVTANNTCDTPGGAGTDTTAIHDNETGEINALSDKASPVGADILIIEDSEATYGKKKVQITNLPGGVPSAHKDNHDPEDGSDALDTAAPPELVGVASSAVGTSHSFARADHGHQIQHGIADNHLVTVDSADATSGEIARFTADGLESRSNAEMKTQLGYMTALNDDSTPALAGDLSLNGYEIEMDSSPDSDHIASGMKAVHTNGSGSTMNFGDVCFVAADGELEFADADSAASMPGLYMALETISATLTGRFLIEGYVRDDSWSWTVGPGESGYIYVSTTGTTGNTLTQTKPSETGDQVQIVGWAISSTIMYFKPSLSTVEIA